MNDRDQHDYETAMYYADLTAFEKQAEDALKASLVRPLTQDEVAALAWAAHIPNPMNHTRS
jgi:hypothetical protein